MFRKRYAVVGTGGRRRMFVEAICDTFNEYAELVGLSDRRTTRMAYWNKRIADLYVHPPLHRPECLKVHRLMDGHTARILRSNANPHRRVKHAKQR